MYRSYLEWGSTEFLSSNLSCDDDLYNIGINSEYGVNHYHDSRTAVGGVEDDVWIGINLNEGFTTSQRLFEISDLRGNNSCEHLSTNNFNSNQSKADIHTTFERQTKCIPIKNQDPLINDDSFSNIDLTCIESYSEKPLASHSSTLSDVLVVPNKSSENTLDVRNASCFTEISSKKFISRNNTNSAEYYTNVFSEQKQSNLVDKARIRTDEKFKLNTICRHKSNNRFSMLVASGGTPLGKLDEIPGVEWHPERQSWKVVGHTGVSWCVRRKTWRVWFVTSNGTRATRSFNPKEHGTVAAALKSAIEFLEQKRAEKSQIQKNLKSKIKGTFAI
ncbi:hypothetical protein FG386_003357 [Cryptosporidium ryanae]|uniref:uncharacterized protein n=1 Tax=Cryptosporidium ryanae TaxID=515981 RepID=UPI00351A1656|nr:hypothetical protein FG386_003357 [Cryptosporidium ryanae]